MAVRSPAPPGAPESAISLSLFKPRSTTTQTTRAARPWRLRRPSNTRWRATPGLVEGCRLARTEPCLRRSNLRSTFGRALPSAAVVPKSGGHVTADHRRASLTPAPLQGVTGPSAAKLQHRSYARQSLRSGCCQLNSGPPPKFHGTRDYRRGHSASWSSGRRRLPPPGRREGGTPASSAAVMKEAKAVGDPLGDPRPPGQSLDRPVRCGPSARPSLERRSVRSYARLYRSRAPEVRGAQRDDGLLTPLRRILSSASPALLHRIGRRAPGGPVGRRTASGNVDSPRGKPLGLSTNAPSLTRCRRHRQPAYWGAGGTRQDTGAEVLPDPSVAVTAASPLRVMCQSMSPGPGF